MRCTVYTTEGWSLFCAATDRAPALIYWERNTGKFKVHSGNSKIKQKLLNKTHNEGFPVGYATIDKNSRVIVVIGGE